jgi:hypothetical protein
MPGQVPLNNAKFTNSPDFNYQAVSGITGSGVFRSFTYSSSGSNTYTLSNSDLWTAITFSGNTIVEVTAASTNIGDEILFFNATGTISFLNNGAIVLGSAYDYVIPPNTPARLVYIGVVDGYHAWLLAGAKDSYTASTVYDCCGTNQGALYTFGSWPQGPAYSNQYGTALYTYSGVGSIAVVGGTGYTISSGTITESPCTAVNFNNGYTFYSSGGSPYLFYSYVSINIFNDAEILGKPFKTQYSSIVYPCDTSYSVGSGTYYRAYDMYGAASPVCFTNGIVTSIGACP